MLTPYMAYLQRGLVEVVSERGPGERAGREVWGPPGGGAHHAPEQTHKFDPTPGLQGRGVGQESRPHSGGQCMECWIKYSFKLHVVVFILTLLH